MPLLSLRQQVAFYPPPPPHRLRQRRSRPYFSCALHRFLSLGHSRRVVQRRGLLRAIRHGHLSKPPEPGDRNVCAETKQSRAATPGLAAYMLLLLSLLLLVVVLLLLSTVNNQY